MEVIENITLKEWVFGKKGCFLPAERKRIVRAVINVKFKDFKSYSRQRAFEEALLKELGDEYTCDPDSCKVFQKKGFNYQFDVYNLHHKIAIEIEKTKTTTLLLDVIKFVVGYGEKLVKYGVIIIPDKYRNKKHPDGLGDIPINRLLNELKFIRSILRIEDILIVVYDTSEFLCT